MIAIGNWTYVAGLQRDQIVMLNLATSPVTVTDWATTRYQQQCAKVFDTYMRDIDISPDGSYFVVGPPAPTGRAASATRRPLETGATGPASSRPGSTTPAATPCTAWPSPGPRSTWAATSGG